MDALENESEDETENNREDENDSYQPDCNDSFDFSQSLEAEAANWGDSWRSQERTHYQGDDGSSSDAENDRNSNDIYEIKNKTDGTTGRSHCQEPTQGIIMIITSTISLRNTLLA